MDIPKGAAAAKQPPLAAVGPGCPELSSGAAGRSRSGKRDFVRPPTCARVAETRFVRQTHPLSCHAEGYASLRWIDGCPDAKGLQTMD